jgi:hypothetical protein
MTGGLARHDIKSPMFSSSVSAWNHPCPGLVLAAVP